MALTRETFRTIIKEGQEELRHVELFDRPFSFEEEGNYVLVGVRQAGKSYMLYKRAKQLMAEGVALERLVYVDFDDERLLGMTAEDFDLILQAYASVHNDQPILFFDEIQNVEGWEHFARRLANRKYRVYISGSNAKMLSRDVQTTLGSRYLEAFIYPYSFAEYLGAKGIRLEADWQYGSSRATVQHEMAEYMQWGGFPELLRFQNKRRWLNQLYEKIALGDIVLRNRVKNEMALRMAYKRMAENLTKPVSSNRIAGLINAAGVKTSTASVIDYVKYAMDACLMFPLENFASKFVERETVKKYYFVDNGFLSVLSTVAGQSPLLENMVAVHLRRECEGELWFYNKGVEVDFYLPDEARAVQVCYSLQDADTRKREVEALLKLDAFLELDKMEIVTYDEEEHIVAPNGKTIEVIPVWKYLLR